MSAPIPERIVEEIAAIPRKFFSVDGILKWWLVRRRGLQAQDVEGVGGKKSTEAKEQERATMAAILSCMGEHHAADIEDWPLSEWRIVALAHWLGSDEMGRTYMAEELKWSETVAGQFMDETKSVLRRRFDKRGLIE